MNKNVRDFLATCGMTSMLILGGTIVSDDAMAKGADKKASTGKIYCWDTPNGKMCGDQLPADAAGQARKEINAKTGTTAKVVERALTPEEIAKRNADAAAAAAAKRIEDEENGNIRFLVTSYPTRLELDAMFDERQDGFEQAIVTSTGSLIVLRKKLSEHLGSMAEAELAGRKPSEKDLIILGKIRRAIDQQQQIIAKQNLNLEAFLGKRRELTTLYVEATSGKTEVAAQ